MDITGAVGMNRNGGMEGENKVWIHKIQVTITKKEFKTHFSNPFLRVLLWKGTNRVIAGGQVQWRVGF